MKTGYFKGNCISFGTNYKNKHYDFPVYIKGGMHLWDPVTQINITDPEIEFAFFFKKKLQGQYISLEDDFFEDKEVRTFLKNNNIQFIECQKQQGGE